MHLLLTLKHLFNKTAGRLLNYTLYVLTKSIYIYLAVVHDYVNLYGCDIFFLFVLGVSFSSVCK